MIVKRKQQSFTVTHINLEGICKLFCNSGEIIADGRALMYVSWASLIR